MISTILLSLFPLLAPTDVSMRAEALTAPDVSVLAEAPLPVTPIWNWRSEAPRVRVWLEDDRTFRRGDRARVAFRAEDDAYVTVVRIDTDGRMRIIYPERPHYDHRVRGGRTYWVDGAGSGSFTIQDGAGMGYVFAIASWDRFDFERAYDSRFHEVGYRVRGDPYDAVSGLAEEMLPYRDALYSTHAAEYYVDNHRHYPRYACNECHYGGTHPGHYHPHIRRCSGIQLVIFGGHHHHHYPDYYPYYYYYGTRRVYVRQHYYRPQYEFKHVARGERVTSSDNFIERRTRTASVDSRRPGSPQSDPNIIDDRRRAGGVTPGAGATRPGGSSGDDAVAGTQPGRRRGHESDGPGNSNNAPGRTGETPRRGADDRDRGRGNSDEAPGRSGETPRRGGNDRGSFRGDNEDGGIDIPRRGGSPSTDTPDRGRGGRDDDDRPRREIRPEGDDRGGERRESAREDREDRLEPRDEPRRTEPRDEPRRVEPRDEPRRVEPRDESPRAEPRDEPRRSEPREEPRRTEPKTESRTPRRESRPESRTRSSEERSTRSEPSRSSGGSRPATSTPRRRP